MSTTDNSAASPRTLTKPARRSGLGRGLGALLGEAEEDYAQLSPQNASSRERRTAPIEHLEAGPFQPRRIFDSEALTDLAQSIREHGIIQPIVVRRHPHQENRYQIIAGERRWRASQQAGLHEVPILIKELSDGEALEISIIENVQREDLSPIEEADGYQRLIAEYHHTHEDLARIVGKSRVHITNTLRLLKLPESIKVKIDQGDISAGHARAVLAAGGSETLVERIINEGLSVREAENLARQSEAAQAKKPRINHSKDPNTVALEREISAALGLRVTLGGKGPTGTVTIHYQNLDQLDDVMKKLCAVGS